MKSIVILSICTLISIQSYSQSLLAQAKSVESNKWGYINPKGEFAIEPQFSVCNPFTSDGLSPSTYDKSRKTFYFIKTNGEELKTELDKFVLMNFKGFNPKGFVDGMAPVQVNNEWGYMNTEGKLIVSAKYDKVREFNGDYGVGFKGGEFFIIDRSGSENQIEISELEDVRHFSEGLAPFRVKGQWGFIFTDGSVAIGPNYKSVGYFSNGLAWAKTESGKVGFINAQGNWVIEPKFKAAKDFSTDGIARVKSEGWTFIDKSGTEITPSIAGSYGDFNDGLAYCKSGKKVGFIDKTGKVVIDLQFDKVRGFKNGYAAVRQGEKWGFIDTKGKWVIEPKFDGLKDFEKTGE